MELFKPYRLIEETDAFVVYEFRTGFLYLLYGILLTIGVGYFTQQNLISCTGIGLKHSHHAVPESVQENHIPPR